MIPGHIDLFLSIEFKRVCFPSLNAIAGRNHFCPSIWLFVKCKCKCHTLYATVLFLFTSVKFLPYLHLNICLLNENTLNCFCQHHFVGPTLVILIVRGDNVFLDEGGFHEISKCVIFMEIFHSNVNAPNKLAPGFMWITINTVS